MQITVGLADAAVATLVHAAPCSATARTVSIRYPGYSVVKHAIDWIATLVMIVFAAPVIIVSLVLVKLTSNGPALYRQTRLGLDRKPFEMLKIRTMGHNCENGTGAVWSGPHDQRVTRVGRFLRDTHLDELPQLWNVLRGEMSLIGPRPERPELVDRIERVLPHYSQRMLVRPGLTGFAQIQHTADLSLDHVRRKLNYDLYYIEHMSPLLDLRIAVGTVFYFLGMMLRAIGKLAVRSHGRVVEQVIETEPPLLSTEAEVELRATG
jgi:lipopolysaccharide/colanic/teichoic acid biosynthesis glycosyltransferase